MNMSDWRKLKKGDKVLHIRTGNVRTVATVLHAGGVRYVGIKVHKGLAPLQDLGFYDNDQRHQFSVKDLFINDKKRVVNKKRIRSNRK